MAQNENWQEQEKVAGSKASSSLKTSLRSVIAERFTKRTGQMQRTNVTARYLHGQLDRLVIYSPHYSFIRHYGFSVPAEKVKAHERPGTFVRSYARGGFVAGRMVHAYARGAAQVKSFARNASLEETGHITEAITRSNVLESLADDLASSRAVYVTSKIRF